MRKILRAVKRRIHRRRLRSDGGTTDQRTKFLNRDSVRSAPFWLPPFLLVFLFVYGAIIWNFVISLTNVSNNLSTIDYSNLDFENYDIAFNGGTPSWARFDVGSYIDPIWNAAANTVVLMVVFAIVCLALGLWLAILVDRDIRFENTFRTIYLLPMSLSFVVTAKFWAFMYNREYGLVNAFFEAVGFGSVEIIQNGDDIVGIGPHTLGSLDLGVIVLGPFWIPDFNLSVKLMAIVFALIWQYSGYAMVVYLAGLRAIPNSHFEAARVDGASTIRMYWRVIIPQLRTATVSALVVLMVFSLKAFDFIYSLYGSYNPGSAADILATRMVREAYQNSRFAFASAIAIVLFVMALSIVTPYLYSQYRRGDL
jgi:glucose/mannose transport system permease protein